MIIKNSRGNLGNLLARLQRYIFVLQFDIVTLTCSLKFYTAFPIDKKFLLHVFFHALPSFVWYYYLHLIISQCHVFILTLIVLSAERTPSKKGPHFRSKQTKTSFNRFQLKAKIFIFLSSNALYQKISTATKPKNKNYYRHNLHFSTS